MTTIAKLVQARAALGDPGDVLQTTNAQEAFWSKHSELTNRINAANTATATLAELDPLIAADTTWLAFAQTARRQLCDEVLASSPSDRGRRTDLERGRIQNRLLSIQVLDRGRAVANDSGYGLETLRLGDLMREAGYVANAPIENQAFGQFPFFACIPEAEARLARRQQQRDDAQRQLDAALREPEPVLVTS